MKSKLARTPIASKATTCMSSAIRSAERDKADTNANLTTDTFRFRFCIHDKHSPNLELRQPSKKQKIYTANFQPDTAVEDTHYAFTNDGKCRREETRYTYLSWLKDKYNRNTRIYSRTPAPTGLDCSFQGADLLVLYL